MAGTIRKHPTGWRIQVYRGIDPLTGKELRPSRVVNAPHTREGRRRAEIELAQFVLELEHDAANPEPAPDAGTVADLAAAWLDARRPNWTAKTHRENTRQVRLKIAPRIGHIPLGEVTGRDLDALYSSLILNGAENGGPLSARSVHRVHVILVSMYRQAIKWRMVDTSPTDHATPPSVTPAPITPPPASAVAAALEAVADSSRWSTYLRVAAVTGARRSQVIGLRWEDIDLDAGTIRFVRSVVTVDGRTDVREITKGGRRYPVAVDAATIDVLEAHRERGTGTGYVFTADDGTTPMSPEAVKSWWRRLRDKVPQLAGVRLHDLRHWMITEALAAGHDVRTVAERAGHADPTTTLRTYAAYVPHRDRDTADALGEILDGPA